jgi:Fur family ferric uptake transcriptional regulator
MSDNIIKNLESYCKKNNIKITEQRKIIAKVLADSNDHPDIEKLFERAKKIDTNISIATTYRTVKLLEEAKIISKHDFGGNKSRYEVTGQHHDHLINVNNGEVIEFFNQELEDLKTKIAHDLGYQLLDHHLEMYVSSLKK